MIMIIEIPVWSPLSKSYLIYLLITERRYRELVKNIDSGAILSDFNLDLTI